MSATRIEACSIAVVREPDVPVYEPVVVATRVSPMVKKVPAFEPFKTFDQPVPAVIALVCGCVQMIRETQLAVKALAYDAKSHLG